MHYSSLKHVGGKPRFPEETLADVRIYHAVETVTSTTKIP